MLELLKQRRVWITIIMFVIGALSLFKVTWTPDAEVLADSLVNLITVGGALVSAVLAVWSYIKPKGDK